MKKIKIRPLRDFRLYCPPHCDIFLKEGKEAEVPDFLHSNLITEKVVEIVTSSSSTDEINRLDIKPSKKKKPKK